MLSAMLFGLASAFPISSDRVAAMARSALTGPTHVHHQLHLVTGVVHTRQVPSFKNDEAHIRAAALPAEQNHKGYFQFIVRAWSIIVHVVSSFFAVARYGAHTQAY